MTISIVIPCLNHGPFLRDCLDSVIGQRCHGVDVQIIVVDGGSTDGSLQIIQQYDHLIDHWVSEPDRGQTHALIKGFARAGGEVMGWLNSDDMLAPGALRAVADYLQAHPAVDVLYGDALWIERDGRPAGCQKEIPFDLGIFLWDHNYLPQPSTFWRRRIWSRVGGLDESLQCAMDCDLWLKFAAANANFAHLPRVLSRIRRYPEQKNQRLRAVSDHEDLLLRERFLGRRIGRLERRLKWALHKTRRVIRRAACGAYWSADPAKAA